MVKLPIVGEDKKISCAFVRANEFILNKYWLDINSKKDIEHFWFKEFEAILETSENGFWEYIVFKNSKKEMLFQFKFH